MANLWNKMKNQGTKVQLAAELKLHEREQNTRKKQLGVELYDLVTKDKQVLLGIGAGTMLKDNKEFQQALEECRNDIRHLQEQHEAKQKEIDILEVKGAHTLPDETFGQKMNKAGYAVKTSAQQTQLTARLKLLERDMKIRKEQFGLTAYDKCFEAETGSGEGATDEEKKRKGRNPIQRLSDSVIQKMSSQEQAIHKCLEQAQADIHAIQLKMDRKQRQLYALNNGETEPMLS